MNIFDLCFKMSKTKKGEALWVFLVGIIVTSFLALIFSLISLKDSEHFIKAFFYAFQLCYLWFGGITLPYSVMILLEWDNIDNSYGYCAAFFYGGLILSSANFDESFIINLLISYAIAFVACYIAYRLINGNAKKEQEMFNKGYNDGKVEGIKLGYKKGYEEGWNKCVAEIEKSKDVYSNNIND